MKLVLLIISLILIGLFSVPQNHLKFMDMNELKKFSYLVIGDTILPEGGKGHVQGTGFFITRGDKLFFVCAKHTLSGCDDNSKKDSRSPDKMEIYVENDKIPIDAKPIKDTAKCLPIVVDPDIIALPMRPEDVEGMIINKINDYEGELPNDSKELVIWGFPKSGVKINSFSSNNFMVFSNVPLKGEGKPPIDEIHYCISILDKNINDLVGYSGAPVFIKDPQTEKFIFVGILVGTAAEPNGLYVVQPKHLTNLID